MKKLFSILAALVLPLAAHGQWIRVGPGTTNTPAAWTNVVRAIGTNAILHAAKLTGALPALDGSALTGVVGGSGINPNGGAGTNNNLLTPQFRTSLISTGGFISLFPDGDTTSPSFSFRITSSTNNAGVYNGLWQTIGTNSPFTNIPNRIIQWGFNLVGSPGYNPALQTVVSAHEMTWFGALGPRLERYDRITLTNGVTTGGALSYDNSPVGGEVEATFTTTSIDFRNAHNDPNYGWMKIFSPKVGTGSIRVDNGYLSFYQNTNLWPVQQDGIGLISRRDGLSKLFGSGPNAHFFWDNNRGEYLQPVIIGPTNPAPTAGTYPPALIWNGTNSLARWEYSDTYGIRRPMNPFPASAGEQDLERHYAVPRYLNVAAGNGSWRRLGWLTNGGSYLGAGIVEINLMSGFGTVQKYVIPRGNLDTATTWQECLPTHQRMDYGTDNFYSVDVQKAGGATEFRVRRISGSDGGNFYGDVIVHSLEPFVVDTSVTGTTGTVSQIFAGTALTQIAGKVGINTNNPQATLHVVGSAHFSGAVTNAVGSFHGTNTFLGGVAIVPGNVATPAAWMPITNAGARYYIPLYQ